MARRLIDASALDLYKFETGDVYRGFIEVIPYGLVLTAPTIDAVEVVRCEKCLHSSDQCRLELFCYCRQWSQLVMRNHYCSCGVRRIPDGE